MVTSNIAQSRTRKQALTEGVIAGVFFGTAAIFIRFVEGLDIFSIVFWRLLLGCLTLAGLAVAFRGMFQPRLIKQNLKELLILGLLLALHFIFFTASVKDTTILNATVLVNTVPLFSMLVSSFFYKLKPSRIALMGLLVSFIGMLVIAFAEAANTRSSAEGFSLNVKGDLEAVAAAIVEAFYLNYGRKVRSQMTLLSTMLPIYGFIAVFAGVASISVGKVVSPFPFTLEGALPLVGLALLPTAIAHTLYFSSLSNLKSFETATLALLEPIGATILGIAVFQEVPAPIFALGAVLVILGILFVVKKAG
jgi:drug/metabolite transporter (DMT)-like permease